MSPVLFYFHDPMCSWCYAFRHSLFEITHALPEHMQIKKCLAGLAKDSDLPMDKATQDYVIDNWHRIEQQVRSTQFNYDFWTLNTPQRSTYPACRAVLSAKQQGLHFEDLMIQAIQTGYYQQAQNPSQLDVLIGFANSIELDRERFQQDIISEAIEQQLKKEIHFSRSIGVRSFPSLVLSTEKGYEMLSIDYNDTKSVISHLQKH